MLRKALPLLFAGLQFFSVPYVAAASIPYLVADSPEREPAPPGLYLRANGQQSLSDGAWSMLGKVALPPAPYVAGASTSERTAEQVRAFVIRAAGTAGLELAMMSQESSGEGQTTTLRQMQGNVPVEDSYAIVMTRNGLVRYSRHRLVRPVSLSLQPQIAVSEAETTALQATQQEAAWAGLQDEQPTQLMVLYHQATPHLVWRVAVSLQRPWESRVVYVDAHDGSIARVRKTSHHAVLGHLSFNVEPLCVGDKPQLRKMPHTLWASSREDDEASDDPAQKSQQFTNARGAFKSAQTIGEAEVGLLSPYVDLRNRGGVRAGPWRVALEPAPADNDVEITAAPLDQVDAFYHVHKVRSWLLSHGPNSTQRRWAERKLRVNVNVNDTCNAYFDGALNFFRAGDGCLNTGRTAGVIYHEYAHGIHDNSAPDVYADGQVGEGIADYVAATITKNPNMRGLFACDDNFRSCSNDFTYCEGDCDFSENSELHDAGQVMCAVLWETRQNLAARYGAKAGAHASDRLFLRFLALVGDTYSAYQAAIAADEDNDDDPTNGTTHSCEINKAFKNPAKKAVHHFPDLKGMVPCQSAFSLDSQD